MEKLEKDWTKYPILHIDLNTQKYDSPQSLESKLNRTLVTWEKAIWKRACRRFLVHAF